ncbi:MAG: S-methyl-5-thioribose-1-phosphate isomerase [Streptosporangiales bacterium]
MRTIDWVDDRIRLIDQTRLPGEVVVLDIDAVDTLIDAIGRLAVRGAPALGVAGALGVALLARRYPRTEDRTALHEAASRLQAARPTAVNLAWGVDRALARLDDGPEAVLAEALRIRDEDIAACTAMGERGADLVRKLTGAARPRVMTVCNTGALAAVERGTALGIVQTLFERDQLADVLALETRPLLQGARLTTWELTRMGAPFRLLVDSAGPFLLARGQADAVIVGADRVAANGDVANKVGTFSLALAASYAGVPFIVAAPESTVDQDTPNGDAIKVEDRDSDEVTSFHGVKTAPAGTETVNPAFDITPHRLVTALVTEHRVVRLASGETLDA